MLPFEFEQELEIDIDFILTVKSALFISDLRK